MTPEEIKESQQRIEDIHNRHTGKIEVITWIPIKDRLPELDECSSQSDIVIVICDTWKHMAYSIPDRNYNIIWVDAASGKTLKDVTHWAEIKGPNI